jgi:hypothetical protein
MVLSPIQLRIMGFHLPPIILIALVTGQFKGLSINREGKIVVTIRLLVLVELVTKIHLRD